MTRRWCTVSSFKSCNTSHTKMTTPQASQFRPEVFPRATHYSTQPLISNPKDNEVSARVVKTGARFVRPRHAIKRGSAVRRSKVGCGTNLGVPISLIQKLAITTHENDNSHAHRTKKKRHNVSDSSPSTVSYLASSKRCNGAASSTHTTPLAPHKAHPAAQTHRAIPHADYITSTPARLTRARWHLTSFYALHQRASWGRVLR